MPTATSVDYLTSQINNLSLSTTPGYFQKFRSNGFIYDFNSPSPSAQFDSLATHMGWVEGSKAYRRQQARFSTTQYGRSLPLFSPPSYGPIPTTSGNDTRSTYFDAFRSQGFVPDLLTSDVMSEFKRLAKLQRWGKKSKKYGQQRNMCLTALAEDFESHYGHDVTRLDRWQDLCREVYIDPVPPSITQCKKASILLPLLLSTLTILLLPDR